MKLVLFSLAVLVIKPDLTGQEVKSTSFVAATGEKILCHEVIVNARVNEVWDAWTTTEGVKSWCTPVAEIELKIGGKWYTNYAVGAKIGDPGSIYNSVLGYLPMEMLSLKIKLNESFPETVRKQDENLSYILRFHELSNNQVKVIGSMIGWKQGKEWDEAYEKFDWGNTYTFEQLYRRFKEGPVNWETRKKSQSICRIRTRIDQMCLRKISNSDSKMEDPVPFYILICAIG